MAQNACLFSKRPGKDFSRNSKLSFEKTVSILLTMQGKIISKELLKFLTIKRIFPMFLPSLTRKKNLPRTRCRHCLSVLFPSVMIARAGRINASGCLLLAGQIFKFLKIKILCILTPFMTLRTDFMLRQLLKT